MISTIGSRRNLPGNWRRRDGTKTDAHLYRGLVAEGPLPLCGRRIPRQLTERVQRGRPCSDCLVAAITRRPDAPKSSRGRAQEVASD